MCKAMDEWYDDAIAEGKEKGKIEGKIEGKMEGKKEMALSLADMGLSVEKIAEAAKVSVKVVQEWIIGSASLAE